MATKGKKVELKNSEKKVGKPLTINTQSTPLSENAIPKEHTQPEPKKGKPGRHKKEGPKAENRTISTDPILFEKYRIICESMNKSLSEFLRQSVECYCMQNSIRLYDDELTKKAEERYKQHLKEKRNKITIK